MELATLVREQADPSHYTQHDGGTVMELTISYEEKGKQEGKQEVAIEMLKKGFSIEDVADVTHIEKEEIEKIEKTL